VPDTWGPINTHQPLVPMAIARLGSIALDCADPAAAQPAPDRYLVLLDPAGHPFCLSTQIPE